MSIEGFYSFTLYVNLALLSFLCMSLPKKLKYDEHGEPKHRNHYFFRCLCVCISSVCVFLSSVFVFFGITIGIGPKESEKYWIQPHDTWLSSFLFLVGLYIYLIYKLVKESDAFMRRKTLLYIMKKYPSPVMSLEKLDKFCKDNDLWLFPILLFREYLKNLGCDEGEEDKNGKAFEKMKNEMAACKRFEKLIVSNTNTDRNYTIFLNGGAFSDFH